MFRILGGRFALVGGIAGAARKRRGSDYPDPAGRPYDFEGQAREVPSSGDPADGHDQPRLPPS